MAYTPVTEDVAKQIAARKKVIGKKAGRTPEDLLYLNSKTGWIKLSSSVNTLTDEEVKTLRVGTDSTVLQGSNTLAGYNILMGGLLRRDRGLRQGLELTPSEVGTSNSAYRNRIDSTGIRPMPGITSLSVKSKNTYGTLREATVKIMVWTLEDFEIIERIYLRPGFTMLLEWGHSMYIDNEGNLIKDIESVGKGYFSPGVTMSSILRTIKQIRKKTDNNYEGMVGYVKNFSWNYTPEGAYDCSVTIISTGEILESLQMRFDPAMRGAEYDDATSDEGIEQRKSALHYIFQKMTKITSRSFTKVNLVEVAGPIVADLEEFEGRYFDADLDDSWVWDTDIPMHWIPLRTLLDIFNKCLIPVDTTKAKGTVDRNVTQFNTDINKSSTFLTSPEHFSIDPTVCVLPREAAIVPDARYNPIKLTLTVLSIHSPVTSLVGDPDDVLNIYVSVPHIKSVLDEALDADGKLGKSFHDILENILAGVNTALGGINDLGLSYDEEEGAGTWFIVDRNNTPATNVQLPEFTLAGIDSVFTDVGISSKISNEIGSQIAIAAQGAASNTSDNIENILRWNPGVVDRVKVTKSILDEEITNPPAKPTFSAANIPNYIPDYTKVTKRAVPTNHERYRDWLLKVDRVFKLFNNKTGYSKDDMDTVKTTHAEWTNNVVIKKYKTQNRQPIPEPIPVELSFKTDGIGGFIIGQCFKISPGILPSFYQDRFGYIITGLEHSIDSSNKWITSITTQFYLIETPSDEEVVAVSPISGKVIEGVTARQLANQTGAPLGGPSTTKGGTSRVIEGVTYKNGQLPEDKLRYIDNWKNYKGSVQSDSGKLRLYPAASHAVDRLLVAAEKAGIKFKINACYRTYDDQVRVKAQYGSKASTPGTSNHGFGLAVDFSYGGGTSVAPGDKYYEWLTKNAALYGFKRLPWNPKHPESWESWHWEYQI